MITPLDIQEQEFSRSVRGYREDEVDDFLDKIIVEMERLIKENNALKVQCQDLMREIAEHKDSESTVVDTLEAAKALMKDISESAEKRAEILVKNAELDAQVIKREAQEAVQQLEEDSITLKRNFNTFKNKYRSLLESELERFDTLTNEIFPDFTISDLKELDSAQPETKKKAAANPDDVGSRKTMVFKNDI